MTPSITETSHNRDFLSSADKVFIYLGVLALASLAVIAALAYKNLYSSGRNTTRGPGLTPLPPANVIVGHLNTGECFAYFDGDYPTLGSSPGSAYPTKIVWQSVLPAGSNHVFEITFNDNEWPFTGPAAVITVAVSGSSTSGTYQVAAGKDRGSPYTYTIRDPADPHPCSTTIGPVGVIVQK